MPQLSRFFGIIISMYFDDHDPPHFHAKYNEYEAKLAIEGLNVLDGKLPPRILGFVVEWAELHRKELESNFEKVKNMQQPDKIAPLQ